MNDLRKAAQHALEALDTAYCNDNDKEDGYYLSAMTALSAALAQPDVPEGWVLVPVEPTLEMGYAYVEAAREQNPLRGHVFYQNSYRAMLAAAPKGGA